MVGKLDYVWLRLTISAYPNGSLGVRWVVVEENPSRPWYQEIIIKILGLKKETWKGTWKKWIHRLTLHHYSSRAHGEKVCVKIHFFKITDITVVISQQPDKAAPTTWVTQWLTGRYLQGEDTEQTDHPCPTLDGEGRCEISSHYIKY